MAKLDKETLIKHRFWIGVGVSRVHLAFVGIIVVQVSGDDTKKKNWEKAKNDAEGRAKSRRQDERVAGSLERAWQEVQRSEGQDLEGRLGQAGRDVRLARGHGRRAALPRRQVWGRSRHRRIRREQPVPFPNPPLPSADERPQGHRHGPPRRFRRQLRGGLPGADLGPVPIPPRARRSWLAQEDCTGSAASCSPSSARR